jgi:PadR family transcriptional regulator, regulatory protein PadR
MTMTRKRDLPSLPGKQRLILELLVQAGEMYGLELVAASKRRLKRGTVYVTLGRMEEKGYVRSRLEDAPTVAGGLPRRMYQPTPLGRRVLDAWTHVARLLPEFAG